MPYRTESPLEADAEGELLVPGFIHEVRHPLMGIKAGLQLVARALGEEVTRLEEWGLVASQVSRLEETLRGYQELMQQGDRPAADFAVAPVVRRALDVLGFRLRRLGPRFTLEVEPAAPLARGAPRALVHAVVNVVANALDALEEAGAARLAVRVLAAPGDPGRVQVRVSDEGPGIPPDRRDRIFEPRFTTKGRNGSGLGLYVARRMVTACGGAVLLVGEGDPARLAWARTEFAVELPASRERP
ncbi:MAG TPA: HAMP domain-containing sensor histidine kinase [Anaeromyxobacteraceae bacterium]|jgi:signal transduction histidine kinase